MKIEYIKEQIKLLSKELGECPFTAIEGIVNLLEYYEKQLELVEHWRK